MKLKFCVCPNTLDEPHDGLANFYLEVILRVEKWGNNLAVRLPDAIVKALKLKTGDEIEIVVSRNRQSKAERIRHRERALKRLRTLKTPLPKEFRFDRDEANAR